MKFEKISFEQFYSDMKSTFPSWDDLQIREAYAKVELPKRSTVGSAGYDFVTPVDITLAPQQSTKIPTGIRVKIEDDKHMFLGIFPRSGQGFKYRLMIQNTVGIIDADYYNSDNEGHIFIKLHNGSHDGKLFQAKEGDKIAQGIFMSYGITEDDEADGIRNGGFGSTDGKN